MQTQHAAITLEVLGQTRILRLSGEVDLPATYDFRQFLSNPARPQARDCVLDVTAVKYIDSSGLGFLIGVRRDVVQAGGRFTLVGPRPPLLRLLTLSGLDLVFEVAPSIEEALASGSAEEPAGPDAAVTA